MAFKVLVGADPELCLRNPNSGKFVSAEGIVPGDKLNPHKVKKGSIQVDGFAAEIGIDPASSANEFVDNINTVLEELKRYTGGYEFVFTDHVIFDEDVYLGQSDKGRELGCNPDFNAYTKLPNNSPVPNPKQLRTFAGHIHLGWLEGADITEQGHFLDCVNVAKQMDWWLGVPAMWWGKGSVRRTLYGKAGCFRVKSYGCEYRTPDNSWLKNNDRMKLMYNNAVKGLEALYKGDHASNKYSAQTLIDRPGTNSVKLNTDYLGALRIPFLDDEPKNQEVKKPKSKVTSEEAKNNPFEFVGFKINEPIDARLWQVQFNNIVNGR